MCSPKKLPSLCPLRYYDTFYHSHVYIQWDVFLPTFHVQDRHYHLFFHQLLENYPHLRGIVTASDFDTTLQIAYFANQYDLHHVAYFARQLSRKEKKQCQKYHIEMYVLEEADKMLPIAKITAIKRKYQFVSDQGAETHAIQLLKEELLTSSFPIHTFAFLSKDMQEYRKYRQILRDTSFRILSFLPSRYQKQLPDDPIHPLFSSAFSMMISQIKRDAASKNQEENIVLWLRPPTSPLPCRPLKKKMPLCGHFIASILWRFHQKKWALRIAYHQFSIYHCYLHPHAKIPFSCFIPLGSYIYLDENTILKKGTRLSKGTFLRY